MELFDAHCHLQDRHFACILDAAMQRATAAGVSYFACCGCAEDDWQDVSDISLRYAGVLPSFGLHPWYIKDRSKNWLDILCEFLSRYPQAGVGEIGLDHALPKESFDDQDEVFRAQLVLASELGRPVSIHCRKAWAALLDALQHTPTLLYGFVIHSYSGSHELIRPLAQLGAYFSFSGSLTFSRNKRAHRCAALVPADRLLIETDTPDIQPIIDSTRNTDIPNEPANLVHVLHKLSELRDLSPEQTAELTYQNAYRLFLSETQTP